jgi:hypothetical protein
MFIVIANNAENVIFYTSLWSFNRSYGILEFNTWRYYVKNFGCSHFKGSDIEDNCYLFRPIYLLDGKLLSSKRRFVKAEAEQELIFGIDYVISSQQLANSIAKHFFHPEHIEQADLDTEFGIRNICFCPRY